MPETCVQGTGHGHPQIFFRGGLNHQHLIHLSICRRAKENIDGFPARRRRKIKLCVFSFKDFVLELNIFYKGECIKFIKLWWVTRNTVFAGES